MNSKMPKDKKKCLIVAEISANHGQSLSRAVSMIKEAKACGADAVKFQAYTPDTITLKADNRYFRIRHSSWRGQTLYELYKKAYTPWNWFKRLKNAASKEGLLFFATAFDKSSVDFLEELGVPCHKTASFELVDLPLIEYMAGKGKPLILSTGMSSVQEIKEAVSAARRAGAKDITLLKCVSSYPAEPREMNLRAIPDMKRRFGCRVGLSDHTFGVGVPIAAVSLGAVMIEKHFTLSRKIRTPDSFFSVEPEEFKSLVENIRTAEAALGEASYSLSSSEKKNKVFRRSLFAVKDIARGELFTGENVRSIRPSYGLAPKRLYSLLGKRANRPVKAGTPLRAEMIKRGARG